MLSPIDNNTLRQITFYFLITALFLLLFYQLISFFPAFLGAITFYIIMREKMQTLVLKRKWKKTWAAIFLLLLSFLIVMIPIGLLSNLLYGKVEFAIQNSNETINTIHQFIDGFEKKYGIEIINENTAQKISASLAKILPSFLGATFNSLTAIVILYFILYFMLINSREMELWLYKNVPLKDENIALIGREMKTLVISNSMGIPLTALLQGVVALIGYLILDVQDVMFWFVVTSIAAMIPFVGAALAYVPIAILFFATNHATKGTIMLLYGFGIVGTVDNIFRFALQKKIGDVHPLITVFGVIVGLNLFGFIGLIFGPILISLFIVLLKIYINEFGSRSDLNKN